MEIFEKFDNIPDDYVPNNLNCYIEKKPEKVYSIEVYNFKDKLLGYSWQYGDSVNIHIDINDYLRDIVNSSDNNEIERFLENQELMTLTIRDFRGDIIATKNIMPSKIIIISVDDELMEKLSATHYFAEISTSSKDQNRITFLYFDLYLR